VATAQIAQTTEAPHGKINTLMLVAVGKIEKLMKC